MAAWPAPWTWTPARRSAAPSTVLGRRPANPTGRGRPPPPRDRRADRDRPDQPAHRQHPPTSHRSAGLRVGAGPDCRRRFPRAVPTWGRRRDTRGDEDVREFVRGGPVLGLGAQAPHDEGAQFLRHRLQIEPAGGDLQDLGVYGAVRDQVLAARGEHERGAEGEHVTGRGRLAAVNDLRRDVRRRTQNLARGQPAGRLGGQRDPEVDDVRPDVVDDDVAGLEVAVHQPDPVDRGERVRQPRREGQHRPGRQRALREHQLGQGRALDVGGRQPGRGRVRIGIDDGRRVERTDRLRGRHLAGEPAPKHRILGQLVAHHLDRDSPTGTRLAQVYPAHAAAAENSDEAIGCHRDRVSGTERFQYPDLTGKLATSLAAYRYSGRSTPFVAHTTKADVATTPAWPLAQQHQLGVASSGR